MAPRGHVVPPTGIEPVITESSSVLDTCLLQVSILVPSGFQADALPIELSRHNEEHGAQAGVFIAR